MKLPKYIFTIAAYHEPLNKDSIVRLSGIILDTDTDTIVEKFDFWQQDCDMSLEEVVKEMKDKASKYSDVQSYVVESSPLQKCDCGCNGYSMVYMSKSNLKDMYKNMN